MHGRLSRAVLSSSPDAHREDAASDLLEAVRELFPDRFDELITLGLEPQYADLQPATSLYEEFRDDVSQWSLKNNISCSAVDDVAALLASFASTSRPLGSTIFGTDENGK